MRPRLAPMAMRSAISRARPAPRMRNRFATFAQAMSSTNTDRAEQHQNRGTQVADEYVANGLERDAELVVGGRICLCQPCRDPFHFRAGLREAEARRQSSDHDHIAASRLVSAASELLVSHTPIGSTTSVLSRSNENPAAARR